MTTGIMESVGLAAITEILERSGLMYLSEIWHIELRKNPRRFFNANGTFQKLQKRYLIQKLNLVPVNPRIYVAIIDMIMIWRMSPPTWKNREKPDAMIYTWRDFVTQIINLVISRHHLATKIIIVNDPCN